IQSCGQMDNDNGISDPITIFGTATKLGFIQQPTTTTAATTMVPAVTVAVEDANGNIVSNTPKSIALAISAGGTLNGTLTLSTVNGVATFGTLSSNTIGSGYTLTATAASLTPATSS